MVMAAGEVQDRHHTIRTVKRRVVEAAARRTRRLALVN
jgi:hypothetical protein